MPIEVALLYNSDYSENIHSYVNNINTIEGGTHLTGFRIALARALKKYADEDDQLRKQIEKAKIEVAQDDFREGLTAIISVKVAEPQFEGQTKTKLGNSEVNGAVQKAVGEAMTNYLEEIWRSIQKRLTPSARRLFWPLQHVLQPARLVRVYSVRTQ